MGKHIGDINMAAAMQYSYSTRTLQQSNTPKCKIKEIAAAEFTN